MVTCSNSSVRWQISSSTSSICNMGRFTQTGEEEARLKAYTFQKSHPPCCPARNSGNPSSTMLALVSQVSSGSVFSSSTRSIRTVPTLEPAIYQIGSYLPRTETIVYILECVIVFGGCPEHFLTCSHSDNSCLSE